MSITFRRIGHAPDLVDYREAWDLQRRVHDEVAGGESGPTIFLLEHSPVYTAGRRTEPEDRPTDGTEVIDVDRGGKLTWHGPGQLVGYAIVRLNEPRAIRDYVNRLEDALIAVCTDYGVPGVRIEGRSGVWVAGVDGARDNKLAAIGIRVEDGVTMHGFALNCSNDLTPYEQIIACGITDAGTTTLSIEAGSTINPGDVMDRIEQELLTRLTPAIHPIAVTPEGATR